MADHWKHRMNRDDDKTLSLSTSLYLSLIRTIGCLIASLLLLPLKEQVLPHTEEFKFWRVYTATPLSREKRRNFWHVSVDMSFDDRSFDFWRMSVYPNTEAFRLEILGSRDLSIFL